MVFFYSNMFTTQEEFGEEEEHSGAGQMFSGHASFKTGNLVSANFIRPSA